MIWEMIFDFWTMRKGDEKGWKYFFELEIKLMNCPMGHFWPILMNPTLWSMSLKWKDSFHIFDTLHFNCVTDFIEKYIYEEIFHWGRKNIYQSLFIGFVSNGNHPKRESNHFDGRLGQRLFFEKIDKIIQGLYIEVAN